MTEEMPKPIRFGEALGTSVNSAFVNLKSEIMKDGAISSKDKALIALACAVAIPCDSCVEFHKRQPRLQERPEKKFGSCSNWRLVRLGSGFA